MAKILLEIDTKKKASIKDAREAIAKIAAAYGLEKAEDVVEETPSTVTEMAMPTMDATMQVQNVMPLQNPTVLPTGDVGHFAPPTGQVQMNQQVQQFEQPHPGAWTPTQGLPMNAYAQQDMNQSYQAQLQFAQQPIGGQGLPVQGMNQQSQQFTHQQPQMQQAPIQSSLPTDGVEYTTEQLILAARPLMDAGKNDAIQGILAKYGTPVLAQLPKEHMSSFAADLRALGAQI